MKRTKAERIFEDTYRECRHHVRAWGITEGKAIGFTSLCTEERTSRRTWNNIQRIIDSKKRQLRIDKELGVFSEEKNNKEQYILDMVQETLNNEISNWA